MQQRNPDFDSPVPYLDGFGQSPVVPAAMQPFTPYVDDETLLGFGPSLAVRPMYTSDAVRPRRKKHIVDNPVSRLLGVANASYTPGSLSPDSNGDFAVLPTEPAVQEPVSALLADNAVVLAVKKAVELHDFASIRALQKHFKDNKNNQSAWRNDEEFEQIQDRLADDHTIDAATVARLCDGIGAVHRNNWGFEASMRIREKDGLLTNRDLELLHAYAWQDPSHVGPVVEIFHALSMPQHVTADLIRFAGEPSVFGYRKEVKQAMERLRHHTDVNEQAFRAFDIGTKFLPPGLAEEHLIPFLVSNRVAEPLSVRVARLPHAKRQDLADTHGASIWTRPMRRLARTVVPVPEPVRRRRPPPHRGDKAL